MIPPSVIEIDPKRAASPDTNTVVPTRITASGDLPPRISPESKIPGPNPEPPCRTIFPVTSVQTPVERLQLKISPIVVNTISLILL